MIVDQLWRYPVKSMIGELVDAAVLTPTGMVGDRAWAVRDEVRGGIRGAKKIASLMRQAARTTDVGVTITLADGTIICDDDPNIHDRLSSALDHQVTLWPLQPADDLDHYRRGQPDSTDMIAELRAVFGREPDEPLPDLAQFPPIIMTFESPPGTYLDAHPLLIMTTSALADLARLLPDSAMDVRRFRPNVVVDTGAGPGHPEMAWIGQRFTIGTATLEIVNPCPRCVMVTHAINDDLPTDRRVLRPIVKELDQNVGVYATVVTPGSMSVGDAVTPAS